MTKKQKIRPGVLVKVWNEELLFLGTGLVIRTIDQETEWDLVQGGDWWILMQDGEMYVFMDDDLEPLTEEIAKRAP